jgi:RNA 3'-phosphate cyclase
VEDVKLAIDIGTAGSITLLLQTFLLPAVFSGKKFELTVIGGTDVQWSIPIDYFSEVLLPQLRKYAEVQVRLHKRGYYPKGEGKVTFTSKGKFTLGKKMLPVQLEKKGTLFKIRGMSFASTELEKSEVAFRQLEAAKLILSQEKVEVDILHRYSPSASMGSGIVLWAVCGDEEGLHPNNPVLIGANALGDKKIKSEDVGKEAAKQLLMRLRSEAPCDEHLADQLIPFMAIAGGSIKVETISNHLRSNIYVAEQFLSVDFAIDEEKSTVSCDGINNDFA